MNEIIAASKEILPAFLECIVMQGVDCLSHGPACDLQMHTLDGQKVIVETTIRLPTQEELANWVPSTPMRM